jgi:hypothetical protein
MPKDDNSFVNQSDWEKEHDVQAQKLEDGPSYEEERLPALIVVKINSRKDVKYKTTRGGSSEKKEIT